jgi:sirohydrochlorin cobaltochelatase
MPAGISESFLEWLRMGGRRIGQVAITSAPDGSWELQHLEDADRVDLKIHGDPETARHIANSDDAGKFRPLKTAKNLSHGWKLVLRDLGEVRRAIDYFYPAMVGVWHSHNVGNVTPVLLRETLGRQSGMYRVTQKATDSQARFTIDRFCSGCLKHRLWDIDLANPDPLKANTGELPLICHEACNMLVAEIRSVVKKAPAPEPVEAAK